MASTTTLTPEAKTFLMGRPGVGRAHTAKLATVRPDGRPHVAPIWFDLDEKNGDLIFTCSHPTVKSKNMQRDPRICLCIDDETPPFAFIQIDATVEISEDPGELLIWATRIGGRYMGHELAQQYGERNAVPGELLIRVKPNHIIFKENIAS